MSLTERFRGIVGAEHVITHEQQLATYESDGLLQYAVTPGVVVLPGSVSTNMPHRGGLCGGARRR